MSLVVDEILTALGTRICIKLKEDIRNKKVTRYGSVNVTESLINSVRFEVNNGVLQVFAWDYIYYLEHGRGKNHNQDPKALKKWVGWAGSTFIKKWVEDRGLPHNPYAVAYKIAKKGTTIFEQGGSDLISGIINEQMISGLKSELFEAIIDEAVSSFRSNVLKLAA